MIQNTPFIRISQDKAALKWTRCYEKDAVCAIRLALEQKAAAANAIFNVGAPKSLTQLELIRHLKSETGWKGKVELVAPDQLKPYNYKPHLILNTEKVRREQGYSKQYALQAVLTETVKFLAGGIRYDVGGAFVSKSYRKVGMRIMKIAISLAPNLP